MVSDSIRITVRCPLPADLIPVAAATEVFPTPPFPAKNMILNLIGLRVLNCFGGARHTGYLLLAGLCPREFTGSCSG